MIALIIGFISFTSLYTLFSFLEKLRLSLPDLVLVVAFFALLPLPAAKINKDKISVEENRTLAKFPALIVGKHVNNNFGTDFEAWFNDRFFMRKALVWLHNSIKKEVNIHNQNKYILVGKDGWAFCKDDGDIQNYQNLKLFSPEELKHIAQYLSSIDRWCNDNNIKFYFLIAPDKNKIYGEYYKFARKIRPDSESRTQQLIRYLNENTRVKVAYPYESLHAAKQNGFLLYFKNDIHWTHLGAYCGYTDLMELIGRDFEISPVRFEKTTTYKYPRGDANILFPEGVKEDTITLYHCPVLPINYTLTGEMETKKNLFYHNPKGRYSAVFFRDSFCTLLADYYLGNTFEHLSLKWQYEITPKDLDFVIGKQADIVVLEQVENFIPKLLSVEILKD